MEAASGCSRRNSGHVAASSAAGSRQIERSGPGKDHQRAATDREGPEFMVKMFLNKVRAGARALAGVLPLAGSVGAAFAQAADGAAAGGVSALPRDLTPWSMYLNADPLVKAVL